MNRTMKTIMSIAMVVTLSLLLPALVSAQENSADNTGGSDSGDLYFGQTPPGKQAVPFAPDLLTIEPHDAPVILPDDSLMIIGSMEQGVIFYQVIDGKLSLTSNPLGFEIPKICQGIAVSPSGKRLYVRDWNNSDAYFYRIDRKENGWTSPISLGEDVNSIDTHWQFTTANNENLYFLSREEGIVVSVFDGDAHLKPVPLKLEDGSNIPGGTPYISPDESYMIFCMNDDLHISYRLNTGRWTAPQSLGPDINSDYLDICPKISPDGKFLFFNRRPGSNFVTYWADAGFVEDLRPKEPK